MPLPLDALREVQDSLSDNMWMLGLPELAPFRAFIQMRKVLRDQGTKVSEWQFVFEDDNVALGLPE